MASPEVCCALPKMTWSKSAAGTPLWTLAVGGTSPDRVGDLAMDPSGNVAVVGAFQGSANFGGGTQWAQGGDDIFVAKYAATGAYLWSRVYGNPLTNDQGTGVAIHGATGNLTMTGAFGLDVDFGGGGLHSAGNTDIFLAVTAP